MKSAEVSAIMDNLLKFRPADSKKSQAFNVMLNQVKGQIASRSTAEVKEAVAKEREKSKSKVTGQEKPSVGDEIQKYLENPLSEEERSRYAMAGIDVLLVQGADMKELAEAKKSWGIGQSEDTEIKVVDFATALEWWEANK